MANKIAGLAYKMGTVGNAKQKNYDRTLVYYPPGGEARQQLGPQVVGGHRVAHVDAP